ncbi:MAG: YwqG family protein [Fimbriimonas sp.]
MQDVLRRVAQEQEFEFALPILERYARPAVGFELVRDPATEVGASRLGGGADVPEAFDWPRHKDRPLDFLLQLDLADLARFPEPWFLPKEGTLSFFYDLQEQPWGFDPAETTGWHVAYFEPHVALRRQPPAEVEEPLEPARLQFFPMLTLPHVGSLYGEPMWEEIADVYGWRRDEEDANWELASKLAMAYHPSGGETQHRIGGYPWEVQNPMEVEAQLVTHGFYCGDGQAYADPRAQKLMEDAGEWQLMLQLDSDEELGFMWGDLGMLYFWNRLSDLAQRSFDRSWMTLQCG